MNELKKKFDETLKIEKEKELKKLEEKKVRLDEIGLIKKEDRKIKIKELKTKKVRLLKDINNKQRFIKEINEKIDRQHITNPKDVWMQSRDMSKKAYKAIREELKELECDLKYLSIIDPRKEFIKTEEQIAKINALNYNNLEKFRDEENIDIVNDQDSTSDPNTSNGDDSHKDTENMGNTIESEIDANDGDAATNAATNDEDIQNMAVELEEFMKEIKNSCLTKSLTDLQLMKHQSYTEAYKELESEVDEFFNSNKEILEGKHIKNIDQIMSHMSNDAIMLLKSRIRKEYRTNYNKLYKKKSFFSKIKSVFSREDKKTNALAKQSKFRKLFNKIKNRFRKNKNGADYYTDKTNKTNEEISTKKSFGEKLNEKYGGPNKAILGKDYHSAENIDIQNDSHSSAKNGVIGMEIDDI